jgi:hypothetical protein
MPSMYPQPEADATCCVELEQDVQQNGCVQGGGSGFEDGVKRIVHTICGWGSSGLVGWFQFS